MNKDSYLTSSFRDPSGYLFKREGVLYRQINQQAKSDYDQLMESGLYEKLIKNELLIPHQEVKIELLDQKNAYKIIRPELVKFISYPYEWSFSQLKDAALTTLKIQKLALDNDMSLKDASSYNIQFFQGKAVLIDTLSFEEYQEGQPWVAYKQFCQHFLAPLLLMAYTDIRLSQLLRIYIDGIPLDLASRLLPRRTYGRFSIFSHLHLHAQSQKKYANKANKSKNLYLKKIVFYALVDNLESLIKSLNWQLPQTEWGDYYKNTNYSEGSLKTKAGIVSQYLKQVKPKSVWDLGANDGYFSRLAADQGTLTIAFDIDPVAVEKNYLKTRELNEKNLLPLVLDLTNPSPDLGWANSERNSLIKRGPVDCVLALALIHHLAISNNLPFDHLAKFFHQISQNLIIEFIPKEDSKVQTLLASRKDIFSEYDQKNFEKSFYHYFEIIDSAPIENSLRTIYLLKKR